MEGPATGQLDQEFSVIFLATERKPQLASKPHLALHVSEPGVQTLDFSSKRGSHSALKYRRYFPQHSPNSAKILKLLSAA